MTRTTTITRIVRSMASMIITTIRRTMTKTTTITRATVIARVSQLWD